jgi:dihydropyrimidinase
MNVTSFDDRVLDEIPELVQEGITTLKVFTAYNNRLRLSDSEIFRVMRVAAEYGMLTMMHAENGDIIEVLVDEAVKAGKLTPTWHALTRPDWGAVEAVMRGAALSAQSGAPLYIVHMNAGGEVDMLQYARQRGLPVMGETCPQYLFFTIDDLDREDGAKWICSPPMRTAADNERLWEGLAEGVIQVVGTDHCPFFYNGKVAIQYEDREVVIPGKELGAENFTLVPNGLPGVGDRLPVLWTQGVRSGRLTANQFVAQNCTNPAKIFGLYPRKGCLLPGADADIVIWDPNRRVKYGIAHAQHRTDYNLYEGWELVGYPETVFLRGSRIVENERWMGKAGVGRFIPRKPFAEVI